MSHVRLQVAKKYHQVIAPAPGTEVDNSPGCGGNTGLLCPIDLTKVDRQPRHDPCPPPLVMGPNGCSLPAVDPIFNRCNPGYTFINGNCVYTGQELGPPNLGGVALSDIHRRRQRGRGMGETIRATFGAKDLTAGGLGDVASVPAGTRIRFAGSQAVASINVLTDYSPITNCLVGSLGPALIAPNVQFTSALIGQPMVTVEATVGFDRNSINDIQGDIITQLQACGINIGASSITVVSGVSGIPTSAPGGPLLPGPCDAKSGADWLSCISGVSPGAAVAGGLGIGTILLLAGVAIFAVTRR